LYKSGNSCVVMNCNLSNHCLFILNSMICTSTKHRYNSEIYLVSFDCLKLKYIFLIFSTINLFSFSTFLLDQKGNQKIKTKKGDSFGSVYVLRFTLCCANQYFINDKTPYRTTRFRLTKTYRLFFVRLRSKI